MPGPINLGVYINFLGNYLRAGGVFIGLLGKIKNASKEVQKHLNAAMITLSISAAAAVTQLFILDRTFKKMIRVATEAELGLARVTTMFNTMGVDVGKLNQDMMNLSARFGESLTITQAAEYQALSSGIVQVGDSMKFMDAASRLAIGGVTDMKTAIDGLTSIMGAYNLQANEMTDVTDAMFLATKKGKTNIAEISQSIGRVAPIAAQMGVNPDELLSAISTLTTSGLSTRHSVTRLNAILIALTKAERNRVVQAEASRLGIEFSSKALREKGIVKFFRDIRNSANYTSASFEKLFQTSEAIVGANALMVEGGKRFERLLGLMAHKAGETEEAFKKVYDTMNRQLKILHTSLIAIMLKSFYPLLETFKFFIIALNKILRLINDILDKVPIVGTLTIIGTSLLLIAGTIAAIGVSLQSIYQIMGLLVAVEASLLNITIFSAIFNNLKMLEAWWLWFTWQLSASNIFFKVTHSFKLLGYNIGLVFKKAAIPVKAFFAGLWSGIVGIYTKYNDMLKAWLALLSIDKIKSWFAFMNFAQAKNMLILYKYNWFLNNKVGKVIISIWDRLKHLFAGITTAFSRIAILGKSLLSDLIHIGTKTFALFSRIFGELFIQIVSFINSIKSYVIGFMNTIIVPLVTELYWLIKSATLSLFNSFVPFIAVMKSAYIASFKKLFDFIIVNSIVTAKALTSNLIYALINIKFSISYIYGYLSGMFLYTKELAKFVIGKIATSIQNLQPYIIKILYLIQMQFNTLFMDLVGHVKSFNIILIRLFTSFKAGLTSIITYSKIVLTSALTFFNHLLVSGFVIIRNVLSMAAITIQGFIEASVVSLQAGLTTAVASIGAAMESLWAFMVENPLGVLMVSITALIGLGLALKFTFDKLYESNFGGFKDFIDAIHDKIILIKKGVDALVESFENKFSKISIKLKNELKKAGVYDFVYVVASQLNSIKNFVIGLFEGIKAALMPFLVIMFVIYKITYKIIAAIFGIGNAISKALHLNVNFFKTLGQILGFIIEALTWVIELIIVIGAIISSIVVVGLVAVIMPIIIALQILIAAIKVLIHIITFPFEMLWLILMTIYKTLVKSLAPVFKVFKEIWDNLTQAWNNFKEAFDNAMKAIFGEGNLLKDMIVGVLTSISKGVAIFVKIIIFLIKPLLDTLLFVSKLIKSISKMTSDKSVKNLFNNLFKGIDIVTPIKKLFTPLIKIYINLARFIINWFNNLNKKMSEFSFKLLNIITLGLLGSTKDFFQKALDILSSLGNMINGIGDAIKNAIDDFFGVDNSVPAFAPATVYSMQNLYPQVTDDYGNIIPGPNNISIANTPYITPSTSIIPNVMPDIQIKSDEDLIHYQDRIVNVLENIERLTRANASYKTEDLLER